MWGSVQCRALSACSCTLQLPRRLYMQQHRLHSGGSATAWGSPRAGRQLGPLVQQRCTAHSPRRSTRRLHTRCQQAARKEHTAGQTRYKDLSTSERAEVLWDESLLRESACAPDAESQPILSGSGGGIFFFWRVPSWLRFKHAATTNLALFYGLPAL